mmetsp:Transcript_44980/g.137377  ORF Transcript_44980/g.137377 Transcript_44980/m.137377 type:complete len:422 (-) Transcript_44980:410-1675(-)|eukprot:CAMPEP_0113552602 /NCGR_PEP_ID=MMETSP0015_2-20120614/15157_1 /TAXON_ID=2838 /ORGANISM="Odontella" /LENGTH=421 /DNA_ID=CAMNT_0000453595 /DNA_START=113 /DNA_END=1378 /DNA_ORIENTATION=+ /assembly_acc=CAM_ASM_000160
MPSSSPSFTSQAVATLATFAAGAAVGTILTRRRTQSGKATADASFPATTRPGRSPPHSAPASYPAYDYEKDPKGSFLKICDMLIAEITAELPTHYDLPPRETKWLNDMLEYNTKGGKMNRGLMVVESGVSILRARGETLSNENLCKMAVLGWAVEWLQAWLLVADDIMDSSVTRRGQPCWYKKIGDAWYIAINDAVTIEALTFKIIKRHFANDECYVKLLDLMMETTLQTELGQLSDTLCDVLDLKDLTPSRWELIVTYKTSFYSFYCSVALGMVYAGIDDQTAYDAARDILVTMGVYFQAQDDYLDCYGTPEQIGKIGTDIQDKKCGWLFTKAYHELCSEDERKFLDEHYGKCKVGTPEEKKIKELYTSLGLKEMYAKYEQESYDKIMKLKDTTGRQLEEAGVPWEVFEKFLKKVYKRSK